MNTVWLKRGILAAVVIGTLAGNDAVARTAAAPLSCTAADTVATPEPIGTAPVNQVAVPTQAPAEPEQNPPGDIPDNQAFVPYTSADGGYTIAMPEGWARTENGPNVIFADKLHTFTVEVTCAPAAPTSDSVSTTEVAQLRETVPAFEVVDVKAIDVPAGPATLLRYRMNSAPDEVTGKQYRLDVERYEVFHNGKLAVISLAVPAGSDNVDVATRVSESFRWAS